MKSSKKRVLSSEQSETGDEPKKAKEGSRNESSTSTLDDVFVKGFNNPDCVLVLANCLRSLEQPEATTGGFPEKKMLLGISQNSQESTCARNSFLIKLQFSGLQLY